jgi:cell division protease FtsH
VQKVTILPRGRALGYTMVLPEQDKYSNSRAELLDQLAYMLGGRAAEELVLHNPTTGASNDIEKATNLARAMVTQYGMTERLGAVKYGSDGSEPFLGRDYGQGRDYSEEVAGVVDSEVALLINTAHQEAFDILNENREVLDALVRALFEKESLDRRQVAEVFKPLKVRPPRPPWTGSPTRKPSELPPVKPPATNGQQAGVPGPHGVDGLPPGHQPNPPGLPGGGPGHRPGGPSTPGADIPGGPSGDPVRPGDGAGHGPGAGPYGQSGQNGFGQGQYGDGQYGQSQYGQGQYGQGQQGWSAGGQGDPFQPPRTDDPGTGGPQPR